MSCPQRATCPWRRRLAGFTLRRVLRELIDVQGGVVTRDQALAGGLTADAIRARLRSGRWQLLHRAVYLTYSGPVPRTAQRWAAVLRAGQGAALSHHTAAELHGLLDHRPDAVHVSVPATRRVTAIPGVVVHRSRDLDAARHPSRLPPQTRVERAWPVARQELTGIIVALEVFCWLPVVPD